MDDTPMARLEAAMDLLRRIDQQWNDGLMYSGTIVNKVKEFLGEPQVKV